jgi:P4 family phage/plasmid primase-like protien
MNTKMNTKMNTDKKLTFVNFLKKHNNKDNKDNKPTNTRIGNKDLGIWAGSYFIPDENQDEFLELYLKEINDKKTEYFTETQLDNDCSILIDIDLRHDYSVKTRQYTTENIEDLRNVYLEELKKMYQFDETPFYFYIFEKKKVNVLEDKKITKDGIHIIIGIQSKREEQLYLREKVMNQMKELWENISIKNTWEDVFDIGISKGTCPWQLYGSTKPGYEPYKLTKMYKITFDESDQDFTIENESVPGQLTLDLLKKLSARCKTNPFYFGRGDFINHLSATSSASVANVKQAHTGGSSHVSNQRLSNHTEILKIKNREMLKEQVDLFLESIEISDYDTKETFDYTMALPEKYYGLGSYPYWIKVGWALRNIGDKMFIVWVNFSSKWESFNFTTDIIGLYEKWTEFNGSGGLTRRSIMHWLKTDNFVEYNKVRNESVEYHINESLKNPKCGDVDIANVLYQFYKDQYVCVSLKGNIWYHFQNHRWNLDESGTSLREHISDELRGVYISLLQDKKKKQSSVSDEEKEKLIPIMGKIQEVIKKLGQTTDKDHIMKEAKEKFYDKGRVFTNKLDTNPYILCFMNGVVDFKEKIFRDGRPEDYVSKCIGLNYSLLDESKPTASQKKIIDEINDFMHKLFPIEELYQYMWEHLASILIGTSLDQTFHMYVGAGRNGKSVLMDLMAKTLGEYKYDAPLSIITSGRTKQGGVTPELAELKGSRYVVMQEPSPEEKINVGPMKMLTGGTDVIQCRAPYMPETVRYIPQFKLCLCTNTFMKIDSQDYGTWRRIRVVEFMSKFTDDPKEYNSGKPYHFKVEEISEKFDGWKETFISMLVNVAKRTGGRVAVCDRVMAASNEYKGEQDKLGLFITDKIVNDPKGKITQSELKFEYEKWFANMYGERIKPNPKDIYDKFDRDYGKRNRNECWKGVSIVRYETSDEGSGDEKEDEDFTRS